MATMKKDNKGGWTSDCGRWRVTRAGVGRYDLHDLTREDGDTEISLGLESVAMCEEAARAHEWAERMADTPSILG